MPGAWWALSKTMMIHYWCDPHIPLIKSKLLLARPFAICVSTDPSVLIPRFIPNQANLQLPRCDWFVTYFQAIAFVFLLAYHIFPSSKLPC